MSKARDIADLDFNSPDIDGGNIDGAVIGATTAAAGTFTGVNVDGNGSNLTLDNGSNPATISNLNGNVTINFDTTGAGRNYTIQTNSNNAFRIGSGGDITFYTSDGANASFQYDASNGLTINQAGEDRDFRVESSTNTNAIKVDGQYSVVGINTGNATSYTTSNSLAVSGRDVAFIGNAASGSTAVQHRFWNDGGTPYEIAQMKVNVGAGQVNRGQFQFTVNNGAVLRQWLDVDYLGNVVFNEGSHDSDFRVESNGNTHALFVDGGNDRLGLFETTPEEDIHATGTVRVDRGNWRKYINKPIDARGAGDGTYAGYLLLVPAYPGSGIVTGRKVYGRFIADRGDTGSGNIPVMADVVAATAYNNDQAVLDVLGGIENSSYFMGIYYVTYNSTKYLALKFDQVNGGPGNGIYFHGEAWNVDSNFLYMARDTEVSNVAVHQSAPTMHRYSNTGVTVFNETGIAAADFRIESDANTHAFFVDSGNNKASLGGIPGAAGAFTIDTSGTSTDILIYASTTSGQSRLFFGDSSDRSSIRGSYGSGGGGQLDFHTDTTGGTDKRVLRIDNEQNVLHTGGFLGNHYDSAYNDAMWSVSCFNDNATVTSGYVRIATANSEWQPNLLRVVATSVDTDLTDSGSAVWYIRVNGYHGSGGSISTVDSWTSGSMSISVSTTDNGSEDMQVNITVTGSGNRTAAFVEVCSYSGVFGSARTG